MSRFAVRLGESSSYTRYEQVCGRLHGYSGVLGGVAVEFATCRVCHASGQLAGSGTARRGWREVEPTASPRAVENCRGSRAVDAFLKASEYAEKGVWTSPGIQTPGLSPSTSSSSSSGTPVTPTSRRREGAARLEEILRVGAGTRPDSLFIRELHGATPEPPVQANPTDVASERSAGQTNTSGWEGTESSDSPDPAGEPLDDRDRPEGWAMCIKNQRVYRRSDQEMAELAGGFPVYSVDFYTSAVTPGYLTALRRDFQIPVEVDLRVPGENDLSRALTRLNVAPAQLNANVYRILVGCFILWAKNFAAELPFRAFQNLYRMKSAPSSAGSYYFQGFKGTFVAKCPDSDKQFKHMWFYAGGRWLHGHLARNELPRSERVPLVFRNGYVWTRAPHILETTRDMVTELQNLAEHE
ncbi:hypothetical protein TIFTF001_007552 [Ficus carica]|uniref:Uncharacterized protein n=1 Tax=Ficus carica TaxID=3494 RepID=A0AA88A6V0_FICCA|nr:hypothetical protein TIFTF001_007552 [Ficus carica]